MTYTVILLYPKQAENFNVAESLCKQIDLLKGKGVRMTTKKEEITGTPVICWDRVKSKSVLRELKEDIEYYVDSTLFICDMKSLNDSLKNGSDFHVAVKESAIEHKEIMDIYHKDYSKASLKQTRKVAGTNPLREKLENLKKSRTKGPTTSSEVALSEAGTSGINESSYIAGPSEQSGEDNGGLHSTSDDSYNAKTETTCDQISFNNQNETRPLISVGIQSTQILVGCDVACQSEGSVMFQTKLNRRSRCGKNDVPFVHQISQLANEVDASTFSTNAHFLQNPGQKQPSGAASPVRSSYSMFESCEDGTELQRQVIPGVKSRHSEFTAWGCPLTLRRLLVQFADSVDATLMTPWGFHGTTEHKETAPTTIYILQVESSSNRRMLWMKHFWVDAFGLKTFFEQLCHSFRHLLFKLAADPKIVRTESTVEYIVRNNDRNEICASCSFGESTLEFAIFDSLKDVFSSAPTAKTALMPFGVGIICDRRYWSNVGLGCACKKFHVLDENARLQTYLEENDEAFMECGIVVKCGGAGNSSCQIFHSFGSLGIEGSTIPDLQELDYAVHARIRDQKIESTKPLELFVCSDCAVLQFQNQPKSEIGKIRPEYDILQCVNRSCPKRSTLFYMLHKIPDDLNDD